MTDHLLDRLVVAVGTQYLVDAEIGRGGMAVVYRATDLRLQRRVAIKVLPPELAFNGDVRERFLREAQTAAQLTHPSIVPIFTVDEREGIVYFVMALVEGESLAERLQRDGRMTADATRRILVDVADALAYAHGKGVVHRDVKPDNIMLDRATGRPMVTDFGIARAAAGDSRLTVTGVAIGTPAYMSPEQALGERELDGRSDIYSLGVIGYQMLAGEPPFKASNTPAMLVKHLTETPRPLLALRPDAPPNLVRAITRALAKRPEERWRDAAEMRDAVADVRAPAPEASRAPDLERAPAFERAPAPAPIWSPKARNLDLGGGLAGLSPLHPDLPAPPLPTTWSKDEWRQWKQRRREWEREVRRYGKTRDRARDADDVARPIEERIASFRRKTIGGLTTVGSLAALNLLTAPHHLWFLIPGAFIVASSLSRAGRLWSDGVPLSRLFSRGALPPSPGHDAQIGSGAPQMSDAALALAPREVLDGPHGQAVRRAAADRAAVQATLAALAQAERDMIPDVGPTVDTLAQRVGSFALTLHRLDADLADASLPTLEARLIALRAEAGDAPTTEQERRLSLLERQRATIGELRERRGPIAAQMESAALALQNLRLELMRLRSAGLAAALSDVTNATQEARALTRDIGHAVEAAREVRNL